MKEPARILVVDDDPGIGQMLTRALARHGFEVDATPSADEAIEKAESASYDAALVDLVMPERNGADLAGTLRRKYPGLPIGLMTGYSDDPDKTAEVTRGGYYHTGDVGSRDGDGYITYVGRADDVFKASGYRISPFEIESVLIEHPAVQESAVIGVPDSERGEIVKAFVVLAPGHCGDAALVQALQEHARSLTAPYKYPRRIEFVENLPKTVSGKIQRGVLRARERDAD